MKLSPNFSLAELTKSQTADRMDIDNTPSDDHVKALELVAQKILQPVRDHFGIPFVPSSGYRCVELCEAIGSKASSQHAKGQAADFEVPTISNYDLAVWIMENLEYDQLILENYKSGDPNSGWVHCSYVSPEANRKSVLTYQKSTGYRQGLEK